MAKFPWEEEQQRSVRNIFDNAPRAEFAMPDMAERQTGPARTLPVQVSPSLPLPGQTEPTPVGIRTGDDLGGQITGEGTPIPGQPAWMNVAKPSGAGMMSSAPGADPGFGMESPVTLPGQGGGTFTVPEAEAGRFTQPPAIPPGATPQEIAQAQIRRNDAIKAGRAAGAVYRSLREQGMTEQEIQERTGWTPQMSSTEAYKRLTALNNRTADGAPQEGQTPKQARQSRDAQRRADRIAQKASRGEGPDGEPVAKNAYARYQDARAELDQMIPMPTEDNPDATKTLYDYLSKSQRDEIERYEKSLARGIKNKGTENRILDPKKGFIAKAQQKMAAEKVQQEARSEQRKIDADIETAKRRAETQKIKDDIAFIESKIKAVNPEINRREKRRAEIEGKKRLSDSEKKELETINEELDEFYAEKGGYLETIREYGNPTEAPVYDSAEAVRAAVQSGELSIDEGKDILIKQFGFE